MEKEDEVCEECGGTGIVEIQTAPDDSYERPCSSCGGEDDFSGATEGDR